MRDPAIILSREAARLSSLGELRRRVESGELHRVRRGAFVAAAQWSALTADDRYRTLVRATALLGPPDRLFSHDSAAAMLRLPSIGPWPDLTHVTVTPRGGGTARAGLRCHSSDDDPRSLTIAGVRVTSLERTVVDMACSTSFVRAVAMADDAFRPPRSGDARWGWAVTTPDSAALRALLEYFGPRPGSARARAAIEFADGASGSPLESVCRVQFRALGLPAPVLQHPVVDARGLVGYLDAYWPELQFGLEIDGARKYGGERSYQRELSPHQILLAEKKREDRMRSVLRSFTRIDSVLVNDRRALAAHLAAFGLVPLRQSRQRAPLETLRDRVSAP